MAALGFDWCGHQGHRCLSWSLKAHLSDMGKSLCARASVPGDPWNLNKRPVGFAFKCVLGIRTCTLLVLAFVLDSYTYLYSYLHSYLPLYSTFLLPPPPCHSLLPPPHLPLISLSPPPSSLPTWRPSPLLALSPFGPPLLCHLTTHPPTYLATYTCFYNNFLPHDPMAYR